MSSLCIKHHKPAAKRAGVTSVEKDGVCYAVRQNPGECSDCIAEDADRKKVEVKKFKM